MRGFLKKRTSYLFKPGGEKKPRKQKEWPLIQKNVLDLTEGEENANRRGKGD